MGSQWLRVASSATSGEPTVALLVFFPRPTGTWVIAPNLLSGALERRRRARGLRIVRPGCKRLFVIGVLKAHIRYGRRLLDSFDVLLGAHLHRQHDLHHIVLDPVEHVGEQFKGFALVLLLRIFLRVAAQVNALAQMVERGEGLAPLLSQRRQHEVALELMKGLWSNERELGLVLLYREIARPLPQHLVGQLRLRLEPFAGGR